MPGYCSIRLVLIVLCCTIIGRAPVLAAPPTPAPLSVYGKLPSFERAALSPSGDHLAVVAVVNEQRQIIVMDWSTKILLRAGLGDVKIRGLSWAGDNIVMVQKSNTVSLGIGFTSDKAELSSMIVWPIDGGKVWSVFANYSQIQGGISGFYGTTQRDGKWFGIFGGMTMDGVGASSSYLDNTNPVLYEVNLQTQAARKIANRTDEGIDRNWLVGPTGAVAATLDFFSQGGNWVLRNAGGTRIATGTNKLGGIELVGLGATPGSVIYSQTDDDDGEAHWFEQPLAGGPATEILQDVALDDSYFDPQTHQLEGYLLPGDVPSYKFFDAHRQKVVNATVKAFPGLSVHLMHWNDAFDRLLVKTEGKDDPQTWWLVDIKTGQANPVGTSYLLAPMQVGPTRMVHYKAADGLDIAAVLTLPPGRPEKNLPVVIFPHGGPADRDYPGFDWWAQAFAARGYAVLQPNFRGSTGYGAAFQQAGNGEWGRKMQSDISEGLGYLAKEGIVDPKRACIMGASYGGYAALAGVTLQQGLYRCAVAVAGVSDVARMVADDVHVSAEDPTLRRALKAEVGAGRDLGAVSPIRFASRADAPVLLIHGKDDTVVPYDQSNDMAAALRHAGKSVEFLTLPAEDHWLSKSSTRLVMLEAAVAFVEKHNPADPQ